jgi:hypothetical protein
MFLNSLVQMELIQDVALLERIDEMGLVSIQDIRIGEKESADFLIAPVAGSFGRFELPNGKVQLLAAMPITRPEMDLGLKQGRPELMKQLATGAGVGPIADDPLRGPDRTLWKKVFGEALPASAPRPQPAPGASAGAGPGPGAMFDPAWAALLNQFGQASIQYTPEHFKRFSVQVTKALEGPQPTLLYRIDCPDHPKEGTSKPSPEMHQLAMRIFQFWAAQSPLQGFTLTCTAKPGGDWGMSFEPAWAAKA